MPGYESRSRSPPSALHPLFEPLHLHSLSGVPEAHIEVAEIVYVLVGDPAALALDGYQAHLMEEPLQRVSVRTPGARLYATVLGR